MKKEKLNDRIPVIGITASLATIEEGSYLGHERSTLVHDYIQAIQLAKGIPVILPPVPDPESIRGQIALIDGLLLSGGNDLSPYMYEEDPAENLGITHHVRDLHEFLLVKFAHAMHIPILGICRGLQVLNVAFGGSLHQDIKTELPYAFQHYQKSRPELGSHKVHSVPGTKLQGILGNDPILVNTFHHQAIKELAPNLTASAHANDGIIEGVEIKDNDDFILGVQWHPELMHQKCKSSMKIFHAFIEAALRG